MDEQTSEEKCEYLMYVVVESRKQFSKICVDYEQKTSVVENKMLKLHLKTIENHRFKPKNKVPDVNIEDMNRELDEFTNEILCNKKRVENLRQKLAGTRSIVLQLKGDKTGKKLRQQITAEALLAEAKSKLN